MFWNGKPVQFFQKRCWVLVAGCQENKSCSKVLNFLERMDDRITCTHEETVAVVKPWEDTGSNKSLGCVFSEKPADRTNAFKLKISSLTNFYDVLLHGQFWVNNESKVPGRITEGDVVRAKSNQIRGTVEGFKEDEKGKGILCIEVQPDNEVLCSELRCLKVGVAVLGSQSLTVVVSVDVKQH